MVELIAIIILFGSLLGIGILLYRKIPVLAELIETPSEFSLKLKFLEIKERVKNWKHFKDFSFEIFLQKILSKIRILTLRMENKTSVWLQKLRENSHKKKIKENDNYWQELQKTTKKNKK